MQTEDEKARDEARKQVNQEGVTILAQLNAQIQGIMDLGERFAQDYAAVPDSDCLKWKFGWVDTKRLLKKAKFCWQRGKMGAMHCLETSRELGALATRLRDKVDCFPVGMVSSSRFHDSNPRSAIHEIVDELKRGEREFLLIACGD